ncbi:MAG: hypothetical protein NZ772_07490 [Cyanobacteria bacterium]|nr:hypothetical protein [Cyanobacteriota bacterium]MDW8201351.1 hypothetical protein [Cyanobacteriota bacterium SKYGB_h_bin112]
MASSAQQPQRPRPPRQPGLLATLERKFSAFLNSLGDVLLDITALEVNTMVVSQITGEKFVPEETYSELYKIPMDPRDGTYFQQVGIPHHMELRSQYCSLRHKLDMHCRLAANRLNQPIDHIPNPQNPADGLLLSALMADPEFLRGLRKLGELMSALDGGNPRSPATDLIYAQTIIQLDGDIINRYHQNLLVHPHKQVIMDLHHQGVAVGEKQWHSLLGFMIDLVRSAMRDRTANVVTLPMNDTSSKP